MYSNKTKIIGFSFKSEEISKHNNIGMKMIFIIKQIRRNKSQAKIKEIIIIKKLLNLKDVSGKRALTLMLYNYQQGKSIIKINFLNAIN